MVTAEQPLPEQKSVGRLDTLHGGLGHAAQADGRPVRALHMAALLVAVWAAGAAGNAAAPALTARSPAAALAALPGTLPALLRARPWRPAAGALAHRLAQLHAAGTGSNAAAAAGAEGRGGGGGGRAAQAGDGAAGGQAAPDCALVRGVAAACLVALRELLPESGWQQVSRVALEACL